MLIQPKQLLYLLGSSREWKQFRYAYVCLLLLDSLANEP